MSGKAEEGFFKIRQTKRSNPEERTTLDVIHQFQLKKLNDEKEDVLILSGEIQSLEEQIAGTQDDLVRGQLENQLVRLKEEHSEKNQEDRVQDYLLNTGDILFDQQDIQEKISKGAIGAVTQRSKRKPGDVLSALLTAAEIDKDNQEEGTIVESQPEKFKKKSEGKENSLSRDVLLEKQLLKINPEQIKKGNDLDDMSGECTDCGADMMFSQNEAMLQCPDCGLTEFILIDSDRPSQKDPPRESNYYAQKRINHFNELLAQFQAKGSTEIPQEVFDQIVAELKKQRITDFSTLKYRQMREVLRKLKLNRQQDHIPFIISRLQGSIAPVMSRETEEKLRHMFREIQPSFQKHCPKDRRNFLSQPYIMQKFCELLGLDEFLSCFPLLKNRDKLQQQSKVWQHICTDMGWEFIRSI